MKWHSSGLLSINVGGSGGVVFFPRKPSASKARLEQRIIAARDPEVHFRPGRGPTATNGWTGIEAGNKDDFKRVAACYHLDRVAVENGIGGLCELRIGDPNRARLRAGYRGLGRLAHSLQDPSLAPNEIMPGPKTSRKRARCVPKQDRRIVTFGFERKTHRT